MTCIFHITSEEAWNAVDDSYRGDTLDTEGFIHCSKPDQVLRSAEKFFISANFTTLRKLPDE